MLQTLAIDIWCDVLPNVSLVWCASRLCQPEANKYNQFWLHAYNNNLIPCRALLLFNNSIHCVSIHWLHTWIIRADSTSTSTVVKTMTYEYEADGLGSVISPGNEDFFSSKIRIILFYFVLYPEFGMVYNFFLNTRSYIVCHKRFDGQWPFVVVH